MSAARPAPTVPPVSSVPATSPAAARPADVLRRRAALALLVSAQFVVMLDTSIVNVALPSVQTDLGLSPAGVAWVVNAYVLAFGGLLLLGGRAADVLGRRRMLVAGSLVFTVGTVLAATAADEAVLVAARVVQGAGAAALSPAAMSLLLVMFPGPARARAMSAWGAASTLGGATGVLAGGVLTGAFGWSAVFWVTVPVGVVTVLAAPRLLDTGPAAARRGVDVLGTVTITAAVLALVQGVLAVPAAGWTSPRVLGGLAAARVLLAVLVRVERRAADPLLPPDLFRDRRVPVGTVLALLGGAARATTFVLVALHLQQSLHLAPAAAGLAMVPTSLAGFVVSLALLPRVLRRLGAERSLVVGMLVLAAGHLWLALAPARLGYTAGVLPALLLVATGVALSFTPTTMVVAAGVPAHRTGVASGLVSTGTQVGSAVGLAVLTVVATAASGAGTGVVSADGFRAAFLAAAVVSLATAAVGTLLVRRRA